MSKKMETLQERIAKRLTRKEHSTLLKELLEWFDEGGAKKVKDEVKRQIESIRKD
jgi:predicted transcriptional regulator